MRVFYRAHLTSTSRVSPPVAEVELRSGDADVVAGGAGIETDRERCEPGQRSGGEGRALRLSVEGGREDRDRRLRAIGVAAGVIANAACGGTASSAAVTSITFSARDWFPAASVASSTAGNAPRVA